MNLITSEGYQMIDTSKHPLHRLAPGVVQGPYTQDSQAHHEWEDAETLKRLAMRRDVVGVVITWARWTALLVCLAALAGAITGADLSQLYVSKS
jgi:hypothetical protein